MSFSDTLEPVDLETFCNRPCADMTSAPLCVGTVDGTRYISVYDSMGKITDIYQNLNII